MLRFHCTARYLLAKASNPYRTFTSTQILYTQKTKPKSHYDLLQLPRDASKDDIHKAYLHKAKEVHPDVNAGATADEFMKIREAYKILHDETQRSEYDLKTFGKTQSAPDTNIPRPSRHRDVSFEDFEANRSSDFDAKAMKEDIENLRQTVEDWESKQYGPDSYYGKNRPSHASKPRPDLINTNLSTTAYTEWHSWSDDFISKKKKRNPTLYENDFGSLSESEFGDPANFDNQQANYFAERTSAIEELMTKECERLGNQAKHNRRIKKRKRYRNKAPVKYVKYDDF